MAYQFQPSFAAGELAPTLHSRVDLAKYAIGLEELTNCFVQSQGGVCNRPGLRLLGDAVSHAQRSRLVPFQFSVFQAYVLEFGHLTMRVWKDGGLVVYPVGHAQAGQAVAISTPYAEADLPLLSYAQSADVVYLAHRLHAPRKLSRADHHAWTLAVIPFLSSIAAPVISAIGQHAIPASPVVSIGYKVSAVSEAGEESLPSAPVAVNGPLENNWPAGAYLEPAWGAVPGAVKYRVYKNSGGIYGYAGTSQDLFWRDMNVKPSMGDTPQQATNPFNGPGNYPGCVTFYQQRLVWASTLNLPQTVWMSQTGNYESMGTSVPLKDDDSISWTIASREVNEIRSMASLRELVLLTSGSEWVMKPAGQDGAVTPTSIRADVQSVRGSAYVPPLVVGNSILHVQRGSKKVLDLTYSYEADGYPGRDLSILAQHLFDGHEIVEWAYQQNPNSIVWVVRDDGALLGLTYQKEHEVWAWHRHETDGAVESIACIPGAGQDDVYLVVRRTIGGQTRRYVERMEARRDDDAREAFFVDSGLTYRGSPATAMSGLSHLEGKTVSILADGYVHPQRVVADGSVTLDKAASIVHVGLPYVARVKTLRLEVQGTGGSTQGRKKLIKRVIMRVLRSIGALVGASESGQLDPIKFRAVEKYGDPMSLVTGDLEIRPPNAHDTRGQITIQAEDPLPFTMLSVSPEFEVYG